MATAKEIKKHLNIALKEVGKIEPWFDRDFDSWIFSHSSYPDVEYAGKSKNEVIKNYPLYLRDFIEERLNNNLAPHIEKAAKERGGKRELRKSQSNEVNIIDLMLKGHRRSIREAIDIACRTKTSLIVEKNCKIIAIKPKYKYVRVPIKFSKKNPSSVIRRKVKGRT